MDRKILHIDCNKFYASVECLYHPEIRNKPVVVGGDEEKRHGIVLTKNEIAQKYNIQTGEPLWRAKEKCKDLIIMPPNFDLYYKFSKMTREIYEQYTDYVEPFSLDECWLEFKDKYSSHITIGYEIKERIQNELGITVSVGASYNKVFAKFGSDYKKPNALTVVSKDNYKEIVWQKPVRELLFIGKATESKLKNYRINTIGELAQCEVDFLISVFGKNGQTIYNYANGFDDSPVRHKDDVPLPKSIGNSTTTPKDLTTKEQIKIVFASLADSVASRLRAKKLKCTGVSISIKDNTFRTFSTQTKLQNPTCLSNDLTDCAMVLLKKIYNNTPLRSVGITAFDLRPNSFVQYDLEGNVIKKEKSEKLEFTIDTIRQKYGNKSIKKGTLLFDESLSTFDTKKEHDISSFGKV